MASRRRRSGAAAQSRANPTSPPTARSPTDWRTGPCCSTARILHRSVPRSACTSSTTTWGDRTPSGRGTSFTRRFVRLEWRCRGGGGGGGEGKEGGRPPPPPPPRGGGGGREGPPAPPPPPRPPASRP